MTIWRTLLPALLICPSLTFAASKEIVELSRDVALLQEQVRSLQRSQDEKFSAIQVLVQQALDAANKANTNVALLQNNLQQNGRDQQSKVVTAVVDLSAKMESVTTDVSALRESVADISSQVGKLQQQMVDIGNAVGCHGCRSRPWYGPRGNHHQRSASLQRHALPECQPRPQRWQ
jgi:polyhydroxyalkanoate synthesis regulator phasin